MAYTQHLPSQQPPFDYWRKLQGIETLYSSYEGMVRGEPQSHRKTRMSFLISGSSIEIDDRRRHVETGPLSLHVTPAEMIHSHWILSPIVTLCADIDNELLMDGGCEELMQTPVVFRNGPVITTMLRIKSEILSSDSASDVILQGLFLQLIGEMGRAQERRAPKDAPSWLKTACALIRERCLDNISIEEIARDINVHPSHLARVFRTYMNQTPGDYLRTQRIAWAAREVARTAKPLQQIATEAGFSDASHFARQFRAQVGVAPAEFRKGVNR